MLGSTKYHPNIVLNVSSSNGAVSRSQRWRCVCGLSARARGRAFAVPSALCSGSSFPAETARDDSERPLSGFSREPCPSSFACASCSTCRLWAAPSNPAGDPEISLLVPLVCLARIRAPTHPSAQHLRPRRATSVESLVRPPSSPSGSSRAYANLRLRWVRLPAGQRCSPELPCQDRARRFSRR